MGVIVVEWEKIGRSINSVAVRCRGAGGNTLAVYKASKNRLSLFSQPGIN